MHEDARAAERHAFVRQAAADRMNRTPAAGRMRVGLEFCFVFFMGQKPDLYVVQINNTDPVGEFRAATRRSG